jgi:hypothetical protein
MILITSGAYIHQDLVSEIGLLPPSFLPLANRRLYEYQLKLLKQSFLGESIYISLPEDFQLSKVDERYLNDAAVHILRIPKGLTLGNSLLYSWNATATSFSELRVLHGDTLFTGTLLPRGDSISVHQENGLHRRAVIDKVSNEISGISNTWTGDRQSVLSGFFSFSKPLTLMKLLVETSGDFVKSLSLYNEVIFLEEFTSGRWLDFGHLNSFFSSRSKITTERSFNNLVITSRYVEKRSSEQNSKILAEASWYSNLPSQLLLYTPHLLEVDELADNGVMYRLEYLYLMTLSDLYVFGRLPVQQWRGIFEQLTGVLYDFRKYRPSTDELDVEIFDSLYLNKTLGRIQLYSEQTKGDFLNQTYQLSCRNLVSIRRIVEHTNESIKKIRYQDCSVSHGDFCFSNLLFDNRSLSIICLDPRGQLPDGNHSIYGDIRYDLAKLYHSVIGLYDFIIAGQYHLEENMGSLTIGFDGQVSNTADLETIFKEVVVERFGYSEKEILAICIHLFISMLPLHADRPDRQTAFIANSLRLYEKFLGM